MIASIDTSGVASGALAQLNETGSDILPVVGAVVAINLAINLFKRYVSSADASSHSSLETEDEPCDCRTARQKEQAALDEERFYRDLNQNSDFSDFSAKPYDGNERY